MRSILVERARRFSHDVHDTQIRKSNGLPYSVHPDEVANIVEQCGGTETEIAAAFLHDVVEDTGVTQEQLTEKFGAEVARIVLALTEKKLDENREKRSWADRKEESIAEVGNADRSVALVKLGDVISNLGGMERDGYNNKDFWDVFGASRDDILWYYDRVLKFLVLKNLPEGFVAEALRSHDFVSRCIL